jgi:hypothetical protein
LLTEIDGALAGDDVAGKTTVVALAILDGYVTGASAGDSGACLMASRGLRLDGASTGQAMSGQRRSVSRRISGSNER